MMRVIVSTDKEIISKYTRYPKIVVSHLYGYYCGGAVDSVISDFTQLHRLDFNLEFKTFFESI